MTRRLALMVLAVGLLALGGVPRVSAMSIEEFEQNLTTSLARKGLGFWAFFARRPWLYRLAARLGVAALAALGRKRGGFRRLPLAGGWTKLRDLPAPEGGTFVSLWHGEKREKREKTP